MTTHVGGLWWGLKSTGLESHEKVVLSPGRQQKWQVVLLWVTLQSTALTISPPWSVCSSVVCKHYSALCDLQFKQLSRGASAAMTGQALYNLTVCIRKWSLHKKYVVIDHHCYYLVLTLYIYAMQKYIYLILYLHTNGASFAFIT